MVEWEKDIKLFRQLHGMKQSAFAELLDVDQATVSRWERGIQCPDVTVQRRLRDVLCRGGIAQDRLLLHLVRIAPNPCVAVDCGLRIVAVSDFVVELEGRPRDEIEGCFCRDAWPAAMLDLWARSEREGLLRGEIASIQFACAMPSPAGILRCQHCWVPMSLLDGGPVVVDQWRLLSEAEFAAGRDRLVVTRMADLL